MRFLMMMMNGSGDLTGKADRRISLPLGRLLRATLPGCLIVGAIWAAVAAAIGSGSADVIGGLLGGTCAAGAAVISIVLIRPWRPLSTVQWPFVFLLCTMLYTAATLGLGFLLYSVTAWGTVSTWLCLVVSYWVGLAGLVRVYGSHMKRMAPSGGQPPADPEAASTEPSE